MRIFGPAAFSAVLIATAIVRSAPAGAVDGAPFSATQAAAGGRGYLMNCASCHGVRLQGLTAPALVGATSGIAQQSVTEVYEYVSQQMPMQKPGSLSKAQYLAIVAYLLERNGRKPGSRSLSEAVATTSSATVRIR